MISTKIKAELEDVIKIRMICCLLFGLNFVILLRTVNPSFLDGNSWLLHRIFMV